MTPGRTALGAASVLLMLTACTPTIRHEVAVEPIEATVNINLRVDRELEEFFDFKEPPVEQPGVPPVE